MSVYVPGAQSWQSDGAEAPIALVNVPTPHCVHASAPVVFWKVPAGHCSPACMPA